MSFLKFNSTSLQFFVCLSCLALFCDIADASIKIKLQGAVDGGGGKAVVCKQNGAMPIVQLLDLWEAKTLYDYQPTKLASTIEESVQKSFLALKNSFPFTTRMQRGSQSCENQDCLVLILQETAKKFFSNSSDLRRLRGVELTLTNDSYELAKPEGCEIQQVVNYRPNGTILVDQDLFEQLSDIDKVALISHEAYYAFLREQSSQESNSIRTRRAIGYVMSGHEFELQPFPNLKRFLYCSSLGIPFAPSSIYFYPTEEGYIKSTLSIHIYDLNGSRLIGAFQPSLQFNLGTTIHEDLFSGRCTTGDAQTMISFDIGGVVEFDHNIQLQWTCKNEKVALYLTDTKPGDTAKTSELNCVVMNNSH